MNRIVKINNRPVWDYKLLEDGEGTLYLGLITEDYGDTINPKDYVTEEELKEFVESQGITQTLPVIWESTRTVLTHCNYEIKGEINYYE